MIEYLTSAVRAEAAKERINELFAAHAEWFYTPSNGNSQALRRNEIYATVSHGRLILSCWTEQGIRSWRVVALEWTGEKLLFQTSRRMGAERPLIELVPRASAAAIAATVRAARQSRCEQLARLACSLQPGMKIERCALSPGVRRGQPGRYARIILRLKHQRIAVTGSVASGNPSTVDAFLSAALLWFMRTSERARPPYVQQLWLIVEADMLKPAARRIALLRDGLKEAISIHAINDSWTDLQPVQCPSRKELWRQRVAPLPETPEPLLSSAAKMLIAEAPEAIDVVHARHGATLRYFGLPFARIRQVMGTERVWFGIEGPPRRMLNEESQHDWENLMRDLRENRAAQVTDNRHALYRNASEAWLESILRRDITRLDPGLIIAPLHAQFRTARGGRLGVRPIDLLALRRDGRLVVIELKVSEDREHVLQGVDYWQRVELHRRRDHISRAKLFGDRTISDQSPLVYLVAPTLRVHPSFQTLARAIAPDIEMYRFDINEDWRSGVRVMRRMRVN